MSHLRTLYWLQMMNIHSGLTLSFFEHQPFDKTVHTSMSKLWLTKMIPLRSFYLFLHKKQIKVLRWISPTGPLSSVLWSSARRIIHCSPVLLYMRKSLEKKIICQLNVDFKTWITLSSLSCWSSNLTLWTWIQHEIYLVHFNITDAWFIDLRYDAWEIWSQWWD